MKKYDEEYKKSIVGLNDLGTPLTEIREKYGIPHTTLDRWVAKYSIRKKKELSKAESEAIQKEMLKLREENEILKKAIAIFAPHSVKKYKQ